MTEQTAKFVVLVAVDLGPHSQPVIERAARLAAARGGSVEVVHCGPAPLLRVEALVAALDPALRAVVSAAKVVAPGTAGDVVGALVAHAQAIGAELVVVGASRRSFLEQVFRGNTTVALTRRSPLPVLVARGEAMADYRLALAAVDVDKAKDVLAARERSVEGVARAVRRVLGPVPLELFTVLDDAVRVQMIAAEADGRTVEQRKEDCVKAAYAVLTQAAGAVAEAGWAPRARVVEGVPSREIRSRIEAAGVDVLVLQPEARGSFLRALVGSLTEEMLAGQQDCDVLVLPLARDTE